MPSGLVLAIDQGTTNTKALLVASSGQPVFRASFPVALIHGSHGQVEQDPLALWESVSKAVAQCVLYAAQASESIQAVAISNQRETALAWDAETGRPIAHAISWQCGRSAQICRRLEPHADSIRARTGLPLATLISAGKWAWQLENNAAVQACAKAATLRLGTVDSWLVHQLTSGAVHATDLSNASRTGLLNLDRLAWDIELLTLFGIPLESMPELRASSGSFGICRGISGLEGAPVLAAIGDSHAAMFGHGRYDPGTAKATYGTGSSLMSLTASLSAGLPALARTIAWSVDGQTQFALEGNIAMTGSAVQWVGEFLHLDDPAQQAAKLAASVSDADGVYFVPAMVGLGAPHWDAAVRGAITGLGRAHTGAHLARAAVDAIAYQVADVFLAMKEAGGLDLPALHADGGATRNSALMQFQANILGRPVLRSANEELSAIGAAWLAGLRLGWWTSLEELAELPHAGDQFLPAMDESERHNLYSGWKRSVKHARSIAEAGQ
jgi:glycerol kinase